MRRRKRLTTILIVTLIALALVGVGLASAEILEEPTKEETEVIKPEPEPEPIETHKASIAEMWVSNGINLRVQVVSQPKTTLLIRLVWLPEYIHDGTIKAKDHVMDWQIITTTERVQYINFLIHDPNGIYSQMTREYIELEKQKIKEYDESLMESITASKTVILPNPETKEITRTESRDMVKTYIKVEASKVVGISQ